jgi:hypothetical protein
VNPNSHSPGQLLSLSSANGSIRWKYEFFTANYLNFIFAGLGSKNKIYITNINDSSLVILKDRGSSFKQHVVLSNPSATSSIYGSFTICPPVAGPGGSVYWCNGNETSPSIFGAGYPVSIVLKKDVATTQPPVFRPTIFTPAITAHTTEKVVLKPKYTLGRPSV